MVPTRTTRTSPSPTAERPARLVLSVGSRLLRLLVLAALAALAGSACTGTRTQARTTAPAAAGPAGARVFASAGCASCHTFAAAHASGQVGPDLDQLQPDL